ncbi:MAG TPA: BsuPI-related putative proteinase inhibitor [Longimicrobiales bacterium]
MMRMGAFLLLAATLGCGAKDGPESSPPDADGAAAGATLASSVEVEVRGDTVRMVLHVTNPTNQPVTLEFNSGQRYDFAIRTAAGADVWTWSADKQFAQMLGTETIAPGATLDYTETWTAGQQRGSFVAIARLASTSHPIREQAAFQIP